VRLGQIDLLTKRVRMSASDYRRSASEFQLCCSLADCVRRWIKPGWRWSHFPAGEKRPTSAGARLKRMGLAEGWPDYIFLPPNGGGACFLEMKRAKHGGLSEEQRQFEIWCRATGHPHAVARSVEEALVVLRTWGVLRV
jgi:hypothetical protein